MFNLDTVQTIMAGALGLTVLGVTEMLKRALKASGALAYVISALVSAAGTSYYLISQHLFAVPTMLAYTVLTFLVANGIFKATHTPTGTN